MDKLLSLKPDEIRQMLPELAKEESFWGVILFAAIILGLILLLIVRLIHWRVSKRYTRLSGMDGLDEEEKKERMLRREKKELDQAISSHAAAIQEYQDMRNTIRTLSDSYSR